MKTQEHIRIMCTGALFYSHLCMQFVILANFTKQTRMKHYAHILCSCVLSSDHFDVSHESAKSPFSRTHCIISNCSDNNTLYTQNASNFAHVFA